MPSLAHDIKQCIKSKLDAGFQKFIIFPYSDVGAQVKYILNTAFDMQESYILDSRLMKYNPEIKTPEFLKTLDCSEYCLILASTNPDIYSELKAIVKAYFPDENIAELSLSIDITNELPLVGKYSYGPLCSQPYFIESIGAFCSFASGTAVVENHEMRYITTHPMIYAGAHLENFRPFSEFADRKWYIPGIQPVCGKVKKSGKSKIGNDVWLGHNVIITNYANIGNGVIAAAGAVITKDIPDYAVVAGVPARIIRYRYSPEQIAALNKICWWDWPDEKIRECYNDFYLPIEEFIQKHLT